MLIAEDLLLLMVDDRTERLKANSLHRALRAALLVELAINDHLVAVRSPWRRLRLAPAAGRRPDDVRLALVYDELVKPRRPRAVINRMTIRWIPAITSDLVAQGVLTEEKVKVGIFRFTRLSTQSSTYAASVRRRVEAALLHGQRPDESIAGLIALLHGSRNVANALDVGRRERSLARRTARDIARAEWVDPDVTAIIAKVIAAIPESGSDGGGGGGGDGGGCGGGGCGGGCGGG